MKYLRIQVPATTIGVTTKMTNLRSFFTITVSDDSDDNETNHNKMAETRSTHASAHEQTRNAKREAAENRGTNH